MEKTQTDTQRTRRTDPGDLGARLGVGASPAVSYLTPAEFMVHQAIYQGRLMGAVAFGAGRPRLRAPACPYARVEMPVLTRATMFEVWTCAQPVVREEAAGLAIARSEDLLFGCLQVRLDCRLDTASAHAYGRIFDCIDSRGYGHLLRAWNYIPQINDGDDGLERYARFNVGRHEAFAAHGRVIGRNTPAASALGSRGDHLVVYFLAAKEAGRPVENPRQTSAYRYPAQYGPRSPSFSRAMLMQTADKPLLFVSGTSSIVGHATLHAGDAGAQVRETIANLQAVFAQAHIGGLEYPGATGNLLLKTYLRDPRDLTMVRDCLTQAFGPTAKVLYLQADICRADLLVEVEAVISHAAAPLG